MAEYNFSEDRNTIVITTEDIMNHKKDILLVTRDEEDGMWQFLDSDDVDEDNAVTASLYEIFELDPSINELYDLPLDAVAYRDKKDDAWIRL